MLSFVIKIKMLSATGVERLSYESRKKHHRDGAQSPPHIFIIVIPTASATSQKESRYDNKALIY